MRLMTRGLALNLVAACLILASLAPAAGARPSSSPAPSSGAKSARPSAEGFATATGTTALSVPRGAFLDPPSNDQCSGAIPIPCGNIALSGASWLAVNDYDFPDTTLSCTKSGARGHDVVYSLNAQAGDSLWVRYQIVGADASIYLVTDCSNITATCKVGADDALLGQTEALAYKFTAPGTYYLILDAHELDGAGPWTLSGQFLSCGLVLPPNDICQIATPIYCGTFSFSATTAGGFNDYSNPSCASCSGSQALGRDVVYDIEADAGDSLYAQLTFPAANGVIYLVGECPTGIGVCYACANATGAGGTETLSYRFINSGSYSLIVDSEGAGTGGAFTLTGERVCNLSGPPNETCATPKIMSCGPINESGSTEFATDDYHPSTCTPFGATGPDVVYRIDAIAGDSLALDYGYPHVSGHEDVDAVVYIVTDCNDLDGTCKIGVDDGASAESEQLRYKFTTTGTYYVILDAYQPGGGNWVATGQLICVSRTGVDDFPRGESALRLGSVPNPFVHAARVRFTLPSAGRATLRIYDLAGRVMRTLVDADLPAGEHTATWDARDDGGASVAAGTYYARLVFANRTAFRKLIFIR